MKQAIAITCLLLGVFIESALWDEQMMQSPDELTVTDFEMAEEGFSVILSNALEDARELVEHLTKNHDYISGKRLQFQNMGGMEDAAEQIAPQVAEAAEMQFRAMRVLGLLEATRDREAGQVT